MQWMNDCKKMREVDRFEGIFFIANIFIGRLSGLFHHIQNPAIGQFGSQAVGSHITKRPVAKIGY